MEGIKKACMNCNYFFAATEKSICTIDKETIPEPLEQIKFYKAFEMWWGVVI